MLDYRRLISTSAKGRIQVARAIVATVLATTLLSGWLVFANATGWLAGGLTWVALVGSAAPAIAVWVMRRLGREGWADAGFRRASLRWYVKAWVLGVALPMVAAASTVLLGLGSPAMRWTDLAANIKALGLATLPPEPGPVLGFLLLTVLLWPLILGLFTLGEEIAWRGYVLPRLLVLGRSWALVGSGLAWGIFHIPRVLVGQIYPGQPVVGLVLIFPFFVGLGIIAGQLRFSSKSVFVTSMLHGTLSVVPVAANVLVVPRSAVSGGFMGLVGIAFVWAVAIWMLQRQRAGGSLTLPEHAPV